MLCCGRCEVIHTGTSTVWINGFRCLELTYALAIKMRAYCEIPGNRGVMIRKDRGRDDCPLCLLLISEGRPGHKPPGWRGRRSGGTPSWQAQPVQSWYLQRTTWALTLGLPRYYALFKPRPRLTTDGYIEVVHAMSTKKYTERWQQHLFWILVSSNNSSYQNIVITTLIII